MRRSAAFAATAGLAVFAAAIPAHANMAFNITYTTAVQNDTNFGEYPGRGQLRQKRVHQPVQRQHHAEFHH